MSLSANRKPRSGRHNGPLRYLLDYRESTKYDFIEDSIMTLRAPLALAACLLTIGSALADEQFDAGKKVFLEQAQPSCTVCHTLNDAGSAGAIGPNLDELKPSADQVVNAVSGGVGIMPAFDGSLSEEQIKAVAYYVEKATSK